MNKENIVFRLEKESEYREVENLVRESLWNPYKLFIEKEKLVFPGQIF